MDNFSVSVIVIVKNNDTVFYCLNELLSQIDHSDEIIVVDDYSDSDFVTLLEDFCKNNGLIFLHSDFSGNRAHNRNIGAARASNPIMVFVDADIILNHKSIQSIKSAYRTNNGICQLFLYSVINFTVAVFLYRVRSLKTDSPLKKQLQLDLHGMLRSFHNNKSTFRKVLELIRCHQWSFYHLNRLRRVILFKRAYQDLL